MTNPLISIIIPTYNRASLIAETLDNLLEQTYKHWECIIVDDGSIDNTLDILKEYSKKDERLKYYQRPENKKKGANTCRNYGFEVSKGDYIQFLDSDDFISSNKLEAQVKVINEQSDVSVLTSKYGFFEKSIHQSKIVNNKVYFKNYKDGFSLLEDIGRSGGYFPVHCYLVKRDILLIAGKWDESLLVNQDGELFCRVLLNSKNIVFAENAIAYYRTNSGANVSASNTIEKALSRINSWKKIDNEIYNKTKIRNSNYVKKAKTVLFNTVINDYPELIKSNRTFFKKQILKNVINSNKLLLMLKNTFKKYIKA